MATAKEQWRPVAAPNFSGAADSYRTAADLLGRAAESGQQMLNQQADNELMTRLAGYGSAEQLEAARANGSLLNNLGRVSPEGFKALQDYRAGLANNAGTEARTNATIAGTDSLRQAMEQNATTFGQSQDQYNSRLAYARSTLGDAVGSAMGGSVSPNEVNAFADREAALGATKALQSGWGIDPLAITAGGGDFGKTAAIQQESYRQNALPYIQQLEAITDPDLRAITMHNASPEVKEALRRAGVNIPDLNADQISLYGIMQQSGGAIPTLSGGSPQRSSAVTSLQAAAGNPFGEGGRVNTNAATVRNNNPGAIMLPDGMKPEDFGATGYQELSGGRKILTFASPEAGQAAQVKQLARYMDKGSPVTGKKLSTVNEMINTWAPPASSGGDNSNVASSNYVTYVANRLGIDPNQPIPRELLPAMATAMAEFESGNTVPLQNGIPARLSQVNVGADTGSTAPVNSLAPSTSPITASAPALAASSTAVPATASAVVTGAPSSADALRNSIAAAPTALETGVSGDIATAVDANTQAKATDVSRLLAAANDTSLNSVEALRKKLIATFGGEGRGLDVDELDKAINSLLPIASGNYGLIAQALEESYVPQAAGASAGYFFGIDTYDETKAKNLVRSGLNVLKATNSGLLLDRSATAAKQVADAEAKLAELNAQYREQAVRIQTLGGSSIDYARLARIQMNIAAQEQALRQGQEEVGKQNNLSTKELSEYRLTEGEDSGEDPQANKSPQASAASARKAVTNGSRRVAPSKASSIFGSEAERDAAIASIPSTGYQGADFVGRPLAGDSGNMGAISAALMAIPQTRGVGMGVTGLRNILAGRNAMNSTLALNTANTGRGAANAAPLVTQNSNASSVANALSAARAGRQAIATKTAREALEGAANASKQAVPTAVRDNAPIVNREILDAIAREAAMRNAMFRAP